MNGLANKATGDVLELANDDLFLYPGCVDGTIAVLANQPNVALVGARLRDKNGLLTQAGIQFDSQDSSYHPLDRLVESSKPRSSPRSPLAAVTGALQGIRRGAFLKQPLHTRHHICDEDVKLCLDIQQLLNQVVLKCNQATAIHEWGTTRSQQPDQEQNSEDLLRLRAWTEKLLNQACADQLRVLLEQQQRELQTLRDPVRNELPRLKAQKAEFFKQRQFYDNMVNTRDLEQEGKQVLFDLPEKRLRLKQDLELLPGDHQ